MVFIQPDILGVLIIEWISVLNPTFHPYNMNIHFPLEVLLKPHFLTTVVEVIFGSFISEMATDLEQGKISNERGNVLVQFPK